MTQLLLYSFQDYREFLTVALAERGRRKALCDFVPCQTTFFSNVMKGGANLSLEHSIRVCEFLGLSDKESHYFMLLVHLGKAGSEELRDYFRKQIRGVQKEQEQIRSQISEHDTVPLQQQLMLYRSWIYVAIHILCAVPEFASRRAIREHLKLPATEIEPAIDFLIRIGVLKESRGQLKLGSTRIHLPKDSPFLQKHHLNWRTKAIQSLDQDREGDLHYTMVMSLSKKDVEKMHRIMLGAIKNTDQLLRETGDEAVYAFCLDWFKV